MSGVAKRGNPPKIYGFQNGIEPLLIESIIKVLVGI